MFKKHPSGLPFLFFTEMWERFGYYLMIGIFVLYTTDQWRNGGLGMTRTEAIGLYGTYIALAYLTPFIGGLLADRVLGFRRSIILGGTLMGIGYLMMAIPHNVQTFYIALGVTILGNGFFKPNISTLLGNLYNEERYLVKKDEGYNIFYMGINLGALVCNFVAAYLRNTIGWSWAFAAAGIGMFLGVIIFASGMRHYRHADVRGAGQAADSGVTQLLTSVLLPAILVGWAAWQIPGTLFDSNMTDAFIFACIPIIAFYLWILWKAAPEDKPRIRVLLAIYAVVIVFWAIFKQNGTALTIWAENYTDRSMPAWMETPAKFMGMVKEIKAVPDTFPQYDQHFRTTKDAAGKIIETISLPPYLHNLPEQDHPPAGQSLKLVSTEIFQSVNPFFVVVLTPLVVLFFAWLRRRGKEPTTPAKIGWGLIISALSTLVTVWAVAACHNGAVKASVWWLITTYAVITVGELCLSPMGLSMVSKMAPRHIAGLMMGGWQLATSIGNKLSGVLAAMWDRYDNKADFFWVNFVLLSIAALSLFSMLRWLNRIFKEKGLS
ncbi:MAG: peptide MFS transporter [Lewinellaceae bacterium]|nr:peptide MFS transporter [Lewinellaceae bacterium]